MTVLELKLLTTAHLNAAIELDQLCFGGLWTRSGYEQELNSPNSRLLILETQHSWDKPPLEPPVDSRDLPPPSPLSNRLIGLACYWSILEEAHITILAIHPDYQNQGLGQFLLYALLKDAKERQLEWATLEVKPSNHTALSVYDKFNFIPVGRRPGYYQNTGEDALILWCKGLHKPEFEQTLAQSYEQILSRLTDQGWQLLSYL